MFRATLRAVVTAAICAGLLIGVGWRLHQLQRAAVLGPSEVEGVPEDEQLFRELVEADLLSPRPDGGLDRAPPDFLLLQRIEANEDMTEAQRARRANEQRLLKALDYSAVGSIVRQQVELWNDTRRIAAIRDNGPQPEGDTRSRWRSYNARGRPLAARGLVPETYGFLHDGVLRPGFADWSSVAGDHGPITFRTTLEIAERTEIMIQVIGDLIDTPAGARIRSFEGEFDWLCFADRLPFDQRSVRGKDGPQVPEGRGIPARAHELRITVDPARGPQELAVTVAPGVNCAPRVHGLALRLEPDDGGDYSRHGWRPVGRSRPPNRFTIRTADGVYLTAEDGSGRPTDATLALGLLPIVGIGRGDSFSLSGLLASTRLPPEGIELRLTIDSELQALAQDALEKGVDRFPKGDPYRSERKSAAVLMNADSGAILAVANYPTVPLGVHPWDYASFSQAFPLRDPASVIAWEVIDKHNTPGSTFKPVTALSLMMAEDGEFRGRARRLIAGLTDAELRREMGLSFGSSSYVAYQGARGVPNFGGATLGRYVGRPRRDPRCADVPIDGVFGLRRAAQFSLNAWFARAAVMLEQATIDAYAEQLEDKKGDRRELPELNLTRVSRLLGIDDRERMDLAINLPESVGLHRFSGDTASDILYPQLARSTVGQMAYHPRDRGVRALIMYTVALNGIGQTISVSPLHMAQAVSTISTGTRVFAHLLSGWGDRELPAPEPVTLPVDPGVLRYLHDGMKAVPEVGTAPRTFSRPLACRMYGKTGTAEIDASRSYNTGWFVGWREPIDESETRMSFACMMTHATGGMRFGGSSCAPVIGTIMEALEERRVAAASSDGGAGE